MRRFFIVLFCILLFVSPAGAAQTAQTSGSCGEEVFWSVEGSTLYITGQGAMEDYSIGKAPWSGCREQITALPIGSGITHIGSYSFYFMRGLTEVTVPDGVTSIGAYAFGQCENIVRLGLPGSLRQLGKGAFYACRRVADFRLPEGIGEIPDSAFSLCEAISTIALPSTLRSIGSGSFSQCTGLTHITIPEKVESIGSYAFGSSFNLREVRFTGSAPGSCEGAFGYKLNEYVDGTITTTAYYPAGDSSWTKAVRGSFGGNTTWVAYDDGKIHFTDVPEGSYFQNSVIWALEAGITTGMDRTHFAPQAPCTRAQVVTFLWRACGSPEPVSSDTGFSDVPANAYYAQAVAWAAENGITNGMDHDTFGTDEACTRAQVATFLWRTAGEPAGASSAAPFRDVSSADYFYHAVLWAASEGITTGTDATTFSPHATCSRAQIVTFLYRYRNA